MAGIVVIGAGVVGVASAYLLAREGHRVTLVDAMAEPGRGASAGNAAQLSWAYGDAMASPSFLKHMPAIMLGKDSAFRVQWQLDADFLRWGLRFLANATPSNWWTNTREILALAQQSRRELEILLTEADLAFDYRIAGKLHLYPDVTSFAAARPTVDRKLSLGFDQRLISRAEAEAIEPALRHYQGEIAGAVYTPGDALGDAAAFCRALTKHAVERHGLTTMFGRRVAGFSLKAGKLATVRLEDCEEIAADAVVVSVGPSGGSLARYLPELRAVRPVRGYSLTVPMSAMAPKVSLTDVKRKLAFAAIGDRFRVAGLADIDRPGAGFDASRFDALRAAAASVLPHVYETDANGLRWSGERPMTPSSRPIIAPSRRIRGVYLNAGHGMLGWTLSLGSARQITTLLAKA